MFESIIESATNWKDFFWIIFTSVATLTSILTYLQVSKNIRQPLYNQVIESQIDVYSRLLELLKETPGEFVYSCKLDLMLKYNLIAHCVHFGLFEEQDVPQSIYDTYMVAFGNTVEDEVNIEEVLENIESITVCGSMVKNHGEFDIAEADVKKGLDDAEVSELGIYQLTNIRGSHLQTPTFQSVYLELRSCMSNIYLPKRLQKCLGVFHDALLDVVLKNMTEIIQREEEKIFHANEGEVIEIDFRVLYNEILSNCKMLMKAQERVKSEIRKLLKIDSRW